MGLKLKGFVSILLLTKEQKCAIIYTVKKTKEHRDYYNDRNTETNTEIGALQTLWKEGGKGGGLKKDIKE